MGTLVLLLGLVATIPAVRADEEGAGADPRWTAHDAGLAVTGVSSLRIHSRAPEFLWAHVHGLGIARSMNGGVDWEARQAGIAEDHLPGPRDPVEIALDQRNRETLWVVTKGYVYRSGDSGASWTNVSSGALTSWSWDKTRSAMLVRGVVVDTTKSQRVLAGTRTEGRMRGGLCETWDTAKTWELIAGTNVENSGLDFDAWPIVLDPKTDKNVLVGGSRGLYFSDDRGRTFRKSDLGDPGVHEIRYLTPMDGRNRDVFACDARGIWSSRDGGKRWDRKPLLEGNGITAATDPHRRKRLYAVLRDKGLLVSDDARHTKWAELGYADADVHEVLVHPRDKMIVYYASPVTGLHVSNQEGLDPEPVAANIDPIVPGLVSASFHPLDVDSAMAVCPTGTAFLSGDRGVTWQRAGRLGMAPTLVRGDPAATGAWWAAGRELRHTPDNGATWEVVYQPESGGERVVDMQRLEDGTLYLLLERSRLVVMSSDGGKTWKEARPPSRSPSAWATSFVVDPANPDHMVMATRTLAPRWTAADTEGGPWESWDAGKSWKPLLNGLVTKKGKESLANWNFGSLVALDPATGLLLYGADGLGVYAMITANPKTDKKAITPFVDVSPSLPKPQIAAFGMRGLPGEDAGTEIYLQVVGENRTRAFVRTLGTDVRARVEAATAEDAGDEEEAPEPTPVWTALPDPGARLADVTFDPHVDGRVMGCDQEGSAGVLLYGVPGAKPAGSDAPEPDSAEVPAEAAVRPPEGLLAFSAGDDGSVRVWNVAGGRALSNLKGHTEAVYAVALAPDESLVATGGKDKSVRLWDGATGAAQEMMLAPAEYDSLINALAFHPTEKKIYVGLEQAWSALEWNYETGESRPLEAHTGGVICLAVFPDGKRLVTGSRDRTIRIWDLAAGTSGIRIDTGAEVLCLAVSPDGTRIYAGGRGAAVTVFDATDGKELAKTDAHTAYVSDLAVDPTGAFLYAAGDRGVVVLSTTDLKPATDPMPAALEGPPKAVFSVTLSRDGAWVVGGGQEGGLWIWARGEGKPFWYTTTAHSGPVHSVTLSADASGEGAGAPPPVVVPGPEDAPDPAVPVPEVPVPEEPAPVIPGAEVPSDPNPEEPAPDAPGGGDAPPAPAGGGTGGSDEPVPPSGDDSGG